MASAVVATWTVASAAEPLAEPTAAAATPTGESPPAADEPASVEGLAEVLTATSYVWRGDLYSEDLFDPSFQPYAELTIPKVGPGAIRASVWAFLPTQGEAFEIDPRVGYALSPSPWLDLELAYTVYVALSPVDDYMHEAILDVGVFGALPIHPVAGVAADFVVTHGAYAYAGAAAAFEGGANSLAITATGGISGYDGIEFGFQDATLLANASHSFGSTVYVSVVGAVAYAGRTNDVNPWGGLAVGAAF
jgi:hypothetical protein